jgi:DNA-binding NarL/FixJ family response regulator
MTATVIAPSAFTAAPASPPRLRLVGRNDRLEGPAASSDIRVLIAGGQALVRAAFRMLLETEAEICVTGEASTGEEAVAMARRTHPDVVLIDGSLPGLDSIEATRQIARLPQARVMMLTASDSDDSVFAALRAGASGFLVRDTEPAELLQALRALARGDALLSPSVTRRLLAELVSRRDPPRPSPDGLEELTDREREVMAQAARGLSNEEIGERLLVSPATAKTHVNRAMMKLRARNRAQLVAFAYESGLVPPPSTASTSEVRAV